MGLLDGLATIIRFQLSSLSAGPDAMAVGVVFAGPDKPQYRVRKSTLFYCHDAGLVPAMSAGNAAA
jgi:hypothetical protein